jgi:hypothetical protein
MTSTHSLDGGGSVAADDGGNVYVAWHGNSIHDSHAQGEAGRAVWIALSRDGGATFVPEVKINPSPTGACGCCGLRITTDTDRNVYVLYRSATRDIHRDMYLLVSVDEGKSFRDLKLADWEVPTCVMSSASFCALPRSGLVFGGWETEQQVFCAPLFPDQNGVPPFRIPAVPGDSRKHPVLAANSRDQLIMAWAEGTGWQKGGAVAWQVYDADATPIPGQSGRIDGLPVWSMPTVFARGDDRFVVVY